MMKLIMALLVLSASTFGQVGTPLTRNIVPDIKRADDFISKTGNAAALRSTKVLSANYSSAEFENGEDDTDLSEINILGVFNSNGVFGNFEVSKENEEVEDEDLDTSTMNLNAAMKFDRLIIGGGINYTNNDEDTSDSTDLTLSISSMIAKDLYIGLGLTKNHNNGIDAANDWVFLGLGHISKNLSWEAGYAFAEGDEESDGSSTADLNRIYANATVIMDRIQISGSFETFSAESTISDAESSETIISLEGELMINKLFFAGLKYAVVDANIADGTDDADIAFNEIGLFGRYRKDNFQAGLSYYIVDGETELLNNSINAEGTQIKLTGSIFY